MQLFEKLLIPVTLVLLLFLGWTFYSGRNSNTEETRPANTTRAYESKRGEMGAVDIEVKPLSASKYEVILNTHSVNLDFDIRSIVKLSDNNGNEYTAVSWSGDRGGHHLNGVIQFSTIDPNAKNVKLEISEIENEVLNFEWEL